MIDNLTFPIVRDFLLTLDKSGNLRYKAKIKPVLERLADLNLALARWRRQIQLSSTAVLYVGFTDSCGVKSFVTITKETLDINTSMSDAMFIALLSN